MNEVIYALWLNQMPKLGIRSKKKLFMTYQNFQKVFELGYQDLKDTLQASQHSNIFLTYDQFQRHKQNIDSIKEHYDFLKQKEIIVLHLNHPGYPHLLKEIHDSPILLFAIGKVDFPSVSIGIVGARRCSQYGKKIATYMAGELSKAGINVVSGLAYGIDIAAHQGALAKKGFTTAILGGGLHQCYPASHQTYFDAIQENGCILSEEAFGVQTEPYMFPKRNRIISGMSNGVLVVEAAVKSGSLITVDFALEQGRDVFAVPNRLFEKSGEGSNNLIKQGAKMVCHVDDILSEIGSLQQLKNENARTPQKKLDEKEKIVYSCISYDPSHEDTIIEAVFYALKQRDVQDEIAGCDLMDPCFSQKMQVHMEVSDIQYCLIKLEMSGLIRKISSCYYARSEV